MDRSLYRSVVVVLVTIFDFPILFVVATTIFASQFLAIPFPVFQVGVVFVVVVLVPVVVAVLAVAAFAAFEFAETCTFAVASVDFFALFEHFAVRLLRNVLLSGDVVLDAQCSKNEKK